jgi:hypothetical protein
MNKKQLVSADLSRATGYSIRTIQRIAHSIPGCRRSGGQYVFEISDELLVWISEHTLRPCVRGLRGRKSLADLGPVVQGLAHVPTGIARAQILAELPSLLKLGADKLSTIVDTLTVREKEIVFSAMVPLLRLSAKLDARLNGMRITPRRRRARSIMELWQDILDDDSKMPHCPNVS